MMLQTTPKDHYVVKYGERGTKFYIIIKGKVSIYVPTRIEQVMDELQLYEFINEHKK